MEFDQKQADRAEFRRQSRIDSLRGQNKSLQTSVDNIQNLIVDNQREINELEINLQAPEYVPQVETGS